MNRGGRLIAVLALAAAAVIGAAAEAASGATLKADYQLQNSYASSVTGAPDLSDIGAGNAFLGDTVNGIPRQVLAFPEGNGLSLPTTGLVSATDHSEVIVFRFADLSGYRRILDFSGGSLDSGLYNRDSTLDIYDAPTDHQSGNVLSPGNWAELAVTSKFAPANHEDVDVYLNGALVLSFNPSQGFDISSGAIRFFKDDAAEESAGAVACIKIYDGVLTASEIFQIATDPAYCPAAATTGGGGGGGGGGGTDTTAPNTKLKKHPAKNTGDDTPTFKFASSEAGSTFKCRIDRKKFKPCRSPFTPKPLDSGKHTFQVEAIDPSGNVDPTPAKFKFTVLP